MKELDTVFDLGMGDDYIRIISNLSPRATIERLRKALPHVVILDEDEQAWHDVQKLGPVEDGDEDEMITIKQEIFDIGDGLGPKRRGDN